MLAVRLATWVCDVGHVSFRGVAMTTRVHQVVIVAYKARGARLRLKMIDTKRLISVGKPTFTAQAVHAAELEFVAQPRLVIAVIEIIQRPVPPLVDSARIDEQSGNIGIICHRDANLERLVPDHSVAQTTPYPSVPTSRPSLPEGHPVRSVPQRTALVVYSCGSIRPAVGSDDPMCATARAAEQPRRAIPGQESQPAAVRPEPVHAVDPRVNHSKRW